MAYHIFASSPRLDTAGQIGDGTIDEQQAGDHREPAQVKGLNHVIAIASGGSYHVALTKDRTAWLWGSSCIASMTRSDFLFNENYCNPYYKLPEETNAYLPGEIKRSDIVAIAASPNHISVVKDDGTVNRWGYWDNAHMGEDMLPYATKDVIAVSEFYDEYTGGLLTLRTGGFVGHNNQPASKQMHGFIKVSAAPLTFNYDLALQQDGSVWIDDTKGVFIALKGLNSIVDLEARAINAGLALDDKGTVWTWGTAKYWYNYQGEASPEPTGIIKPAAVAKSFFVQLNDAYVPLNSEPVIINGTTFVPLRDVFEAVGAKVTYASGKITILKGGTKLELEVYRHRARINGTDKQMPAAPRYYQNKAVVPLRFATEALGANVSWNSAKDTIVIRMESNVNG
ncbi:stalk domain-containing protein [Paenibacillus sp. LPE1-1-1.1]|uniref:stalk domain-containing protein n=1 Tax=Paenibacillus sp. LPE1-1-1.1 TaxID=3135230 RepID=UPI0034388549